MLCRSANLLSDPACQAMTSNEVQIQCCCRRTEVGSVMPAAEPMWSCWSCIREALFFAPRRSPMWNLCRLDANVGRWVGGTQAHGDRRDQRPVQRS